MSRPRDISGELLTRFSLRNSVPMNLLFIVLVFLGALVVSRMPVDVYPDVSLDEATVHTFWFGASSEDVERLVTDRIEDKILDIRGVDRIISDSKPDLSRIRVKFRESLSPSEFDAALRQLRASVDQVTDLPPDAEKPVVTKISVAEIFFLLFVVIEDVDGVGEQVLHELAYQLKSTLRDVPGVGKVDDQFIRDREVHVLVNHDELRKYGQTLQDIATVMEQYNRDVPSGNLTGPEGDLTIRAVGGVVHPEQLGSIVVFKNPRGGHVYLRDVAKIRAGFERKTLFPRYNLNDCLALGVAKIQQADSRTVVTDVRHALDEFERRLPPGVALHVADDASGIIASRLHVLGSNLGWGIGLVFLVLLAVVGLRNAMLAIVGIPFSFFCALIFMHLIGVTINAVSLIGLVLCTGMIVDDAIVVLENIYRHVERRCSDTATTLGKAELRTCIVEGTAEVLWPVIASSATTVAAFLPLLIMSGVTGAFFSIIPKTVTVVLAASLFECLLMLPVHYLDWGARRRRRQPRTTAGSADQGPSEILHAEDELRDRGRLARVYDAVLRAMLDHRYVAVLPLVGLAMLAVSALPFIDVELFPSDFQHCLVDVRTADEASVDQTAEAVEPIERIALSMGSEHVSAVLTWIGFVITEENDVKIRQNVGQLHVQLASTSQVGADSAAIASELRNRIQAYLDEHPEVPIESFRVWAPRSGPPVGKPVTIRIDCPNFKTAMILAEEYKALLHSIDGVHGIGGNLDFGQRQINLTIDENRASVHGLTFLNIAAALRMANDGQIVSSFKDKRTGEALNVRLLLDEAFRRDIDDLLDVDVRTVGGYVTRLGDLTELDVTQGYAGIPHVNGRRVVTVTAQVDTAVTTARDVNETIKSAFAARLEGMSDVRVLYGGEYAETEASFSSLKDAYLIALLVIYMILATQFRSYGQPLVIIATVPFACIGVIGGLLLSDYPFTIMTFIAVVGMSGVVVNDSILLVDSINRAIVRGSSLRDAIRIAAVRRARPIIMTTVTTVVGLAPLALGMGGYSKIWSPFASSFVWGLAFSTVVTMLYVPAAYLIAKDVARVFRPHSDADVVAAEAV